MPLIEKAWAKSHGDYDKIDKGRSSECLRDLTGAPAFTFNIDDEKINITRKLQKGFMKEYIMTAFADSKMNKNNVKEKIQNNHTYALINYFDYEYEEETKYEILSDD